MSWKVSLDRYLTSGPDDDGFDNWCEAVIESISDEFYEKNEDWINKYGEVSNEWFNKIFKRKDYLTPKESAKLIERAHRLYIKS